MMSKTNVTGDNAAVDAPEANTDQVTRMCFSDANLTDRNDHTSKKSIQGEDASVRRVSGFSPKHCSKSSGMTVGLSH